MATVPSTELGNPTAERERTWLRLSGRRRRAWPVRLFAAPPALPDSDGRKGACVFVHHHWSTLIQAGLVHGIAAVAIAAFAVLLARRLRPGTSDATRTLFLGAAVTAVVVSLIQWPVDWSEPPYRREHEREHYCLPISRGQHRRHGQARTPWCCGRGGGAPWPGDRRTTKVACAFGLHAAANPDPRWPCFRRGFRCVERGPRRILAAAPRLGRLRQRDSHQGPSAAGGVTS